METYLSYNNSYCAHNDDSTSLDMCVKGFNVIWIICLEIEHKLSSQRTKEQKSANILYKN